MRRLLVPVFAIPALACQASLAADTVSREPLALEGMQITADAERADGPVDGYRATRSASATRTDTPIHEIPQSISVVPEQVIEDIGATRVEDALDYAGDHQSSGVVVLHHGRILADYRRALPFPVNDDP